MNLMLLICALVAASGGFLFGIDVLKDGQEFLNQ